ncbi:hypothetical protein T10_9711 [Trichinella papuae]|uniref:Uncharacterized protein n=1 Tax=Trichinella papuae TaxID=268474 RepID=A0A0V1N337_9BILA|nr:hypothetical protein T10_9711 [Trichinella papuae]
MKGKTGPFIQLLTRDKIKRLFRKLVLSLKNSLIEKFIDKNPGRMLTKYENSSSTQKLNTEIAVDYLTIIYFVEQLMLSVGIYYAHLRICSNINVTGFCSQNRPLDFINLYIVTQIEENYSSKNNNCGAAIRNILTLLFTNNFALIEFNIIECNRHLTKEKVKIVN